MTLAIGNWDFQHRPDTILGQTWAFIGSTSLPTNVAVGDLTVSRLFVTDGALDSEARKAQVLDVYTPGAGAFNSFFVKATVSPPAMVASDEQRSAKFSLKVHPTANYVGTGTGFYAEADHDSGAFNVAALQGFFAQALQGVAGTTVTSLVASRAAYRAILGTATEAVGFDITRGVGSDAGAIGTGIGLRIRASDTVIPTTDIAIQSLGGHHRFIGGINIGSDDAPTGGYLLHVRGSVLITNNNNLAWTDSGGTPRTAFFLGGDDETNFSVAGGSGKHFRILNQALAASLWQITNAGVQDLDQLYANGGALRWLDSGATSRALLQLAIDNYVNIFNAGGAGKKVRVLNQAGASELWGVDNSGNMNWIGTATATPSAAQTLVAATAILANATFVMITAAAPVVSTANPQIAVGSDGQVLIILNVGANAITLNANGVKYGAAAAPVLAQDSMVTLIYSATQGLWEQVARSL